jgi:dTDP-glucose pyrophosphorylase
MKSFTDISQNCLSSEKKLSDIKKIFKKIKKKIVFIVKSKKLIGTITDGDIRKIHFSSNANSISVLKVMNQNPSFVYQGYEKKDLNKIKNKIRYLPVLNKKNKIIKILDLQYLKNLKHENSVIIFAGGVGKRLRPFTKKIPKPMLKIANRPNLEILIEKIYKQGFKNINLSLRYKHNYIINKIKKFKDINYNIEQKPLGTAGGLSVMKFNNKLPVIAINADLITNLDLNNLLNYHNSTKSDFTISVKKRIFTVPFATVNIKNNKITTIEEKPSKDYFFNAGIYVLDQKIIKMLKKNQKIDMPDLIHKSIKKGLKINAFYMYEDWVDYGSKETFLNLRKKNEYKKIRK